MVETLVCALGALHAEVWLVESRDGHVLVRAAPLGGAEESPYGAIIDLASDLPPARAARARSACFESDGLRDCEWAARHGARGAAFLSLVAADTLHGVATCWFPDPIRAEVAAVLPSFASIIASSLADIALLHRERAARAQAEAARERLVEQTEAAESRASLLASANEELRRQQQEREVAERRLEAQYEVLRALVQPGDLDELGPRVLQAIGGSLGWGVGALWLADDRTAELRAAAVWAAPGVAADELLERTRRATYASGESTVGRVFQTGETAWLDDLATAQPRRARLAAEAGLNAGIWFPVRAGNAVFGVVEFFLQQRLPPDEEILRSVTALGAQLGQTLARLRAQGVASDSEERLGTTLRAVGDAVLTTDLDGRVDFMNPVAEALTGWPLGEARGLPLEQVFVIRSEESDQPVESPVTKVMRDGLVVGLANHTVLVHRDGHRFNIDDSGAPIRDAKGQLRGVALVFRNVSEKKKVDRRRRFLAEASARLSTSLDLDETLPAVAAAATGGLADWCAIDVLESDGTLRSAAFAHSDSERAELARQLRERYPPDPKVSQGIGRVLHTGEPILATELGPAELAAMALDAEHFRLLQELGLCSLMVVPLTARGRTLGTVLFASASPSRRYNLEDLAMAEEFGRRAGLALDNARLLREAQQAVRVRDEFLSIASHELKTPLTSLKLQIQTLQRAARLAPEVASEPLLAKLTSADRQTNYLAKLVENLLEVSRLDEDCCKLELQEVDAVALTRGIVETFGERMQRAGCTVTLDAPGPVIGCWDKLRLEQAIANLLSNALKYGAGHPVEVTVIREGEAAVLQVADHGIGINPADLGRIFARFERASSSLNYGGLGVGLFIVQRSIEAMGGQVKVVSTPGAGTTFSVYLPLGGPKCRRASDSKAEGCRASGANG